MTSETLKVLIVGGQGALGSALIDYFKTEPCWIASVSFGKAEKADLNIRTESIQNMQEQVTYIEKKLLDANADLKLNGIISVAGGWAGGNISSKDFLKIADLMWRQNAQSSLVAAALSAKFLKEDGLLVLTGAQGALDPSPGMIGYGMSKAAVHHLTRSLGSDESGMPKDSKIVAILPGILDTPNNRKYMPGADYDSWTPLVDIAKLLRGWLTGVGSAPRSGSLVTLNTKGGQTTIEIN